eukprot:Em0006g302a
MALAFALIKQMLKLENRSKEACDFGRDLWIASRAATCAKNNEASSPQAPTARGVETHPRAEHFSSLAWCFLPQGLHQTLLPLQLKLKGLAVRQRRCPGQQASQGSNSATEYRQVVTANGRERAQRQLQLGQKHAHGEGSALKCPSVYNYVLK